MVMPGRSFSAGSEYGFGFNGQEQVDEVYGNGNLNSAAFWEYDTRVGRRWNIDPKKTHSNSSYNCFNDSPIVYTDVLGDTSKIFNRSNNRLIETLDDGSADVTYIKVNKHRYNLYKSSERHRIIRGGGSFEEYMHNTDYVVGFIGGFEILETVRANLRGDNVNSYFMSTKQLQFDYTGTMNPRSEVTTNTSKTKPDYINGTLTVSAVFKDGSKIQLLSYIAYSGPWYGGPLINGRYLADDYVPTTEDGMVANRGTNDQVGFKIIMTPTFATLRGSFRIHFDEDANGTAGCIGLHCTTEELIHFRNLTRNYFDTNKHTAYIIVNVPNNPNYPDPPNSRPVGQ